MHEASCHERNCFITLTYDDEHLPADRSLDHRHFQLFMKKLRKRLGPVRVRFFEGAEYGEKERRPHYHAIIFGFDFPDRKYWTTKNGNKLYRSQMLEELWTLGVSSIGDVSFESAAYVARYTIGKITGDDADGHYTTINPDTLEEVKRVPEYARMSLKPGIGKEWITKYESDVYPAGRMLAPGRGVLVNPGRYYDHHFKKIDAMRQSFIERGDSPNYELMQLERVELAKLSLMDRTAYRLRVREAVAKANLKQRKL